MRFTAYMKYNPMSGHPTTDAWGRRIDDALREARATRVAVDSISLDGWSLQYSRDRWEWYLSFSNEENMNLTIADFIAANGCWSVSSVKVSYDVPDDKKRRPRRGHYADDKDWADCTATVTSELRERYGFVLTAAVEVPHRMYGPYLAAVLKRAVSPLVWHEPKPWWWRLRHPFAYH